jgi:protein arginine kinase activator
MNFACQSCKQQPATVHLTDIARDGEKRERHLCESCAQKEGVTPNPQPMAKVSHLLTAFVEGGKAGAKQIADLACPDCGMTFVEFRSSGLLGCANDYKAFEKALVPLIERAHQGASHHIGKLPRRQGKSRVVENDLLRLRRKLTRAVDDERFEEAAKLRDDISTLESP